MNAFEFANSVAGFLGHGCALGQQDPRISGRFSSFQELNKAWATQAEAMENPSLPSPIYGWNLEDGVLSHITASGRFAVEVHLDHATIEIVAGPNNELGPEPRTAVEVVYRFDRGGSKGWVEVAHVDPALLEGRPDRVALLVELHQRVGWPPFHPNTISGERPAVVLMAVAEYQHQIAGKRWELEELERQLQHLLTPPAVETSSAEMSTRRRSRRTQFCAKE